MKFANLTPHSITVRSDGGTEAVIPASGSVARCQVASEKVGDLNGIPVVRQVFGTPQGIPEPVEGVIYITSTLVAQAAGREDVVSPDTGPTAYRESGQVVAVRGFQIFPPSPLTKAVRKLAAEAANGMQDCHGWVVAARVQLLAENVLNLLR